MSSGSQTLLRSVRPAALGKYLGQLALVLSLLCLVPLAAALVFGDYYAGCAHLLVIASLLLPFFLSTTVPPPVRLQTNEALVIVALAFVLSSLCSSCLLLGSGLSFGEALFESVSAITTTGLSVVDHTKDLSRTFLFTRSWLQWFGGLGIVVLSIALIFGHQISSRRLVEAPADKDLVGTTRAYARHIFIVYAFLSLVALGLLLLVGMGFFDAIVYGLSAISTGGFAPDVESLAYLHPAVQAVTVVFIGLLGAIPLHFYYRFRQRGWKTTIADSELRLLFFAVALCCLTLTVLLHLNGMEWNQAVFHALIQGVSAQSTSGFSSLSIAELDDATKLTLIASMLVGGGLGSTAGGIKVLRLLILLRLIHFLLRKSALPAHAITNPRISDRALDKDDIQNALFLILLFFIIVFASWFAFVAYGYPPVDALFEVVSATATVGLSTGISRTELEPPLQALLCFDMLLGRVEIVALLVVLYPPTWFAKRIASR